MFFDEFTKSQLASWPLARNNYERLRNVIYRTIDFEGFQIRIQYNPDRIQSAVAKIDEQSIKARACFLCKGNIPPEQASFDYNPTLDIRVNPSNIRSPLHGSGQATHTPAHQGTFPRYAGHCTNLSGVHDLL